MKPATAYSFSRAGRSRASISAIASSMQLPALGEERVEDLLLRAEVVVDEAVRDARLVRHVRHAAAVEALAREDADRGVEDQRGACRRRPPPARRAPSGARPPRASGRRSATRFARLGSFSRTSVLARRGRGRRRRSRRRRRARAQAPRPTGRRSSSRRSSRCPAGAGRPGRRRSRTPGSRSRGRGSGSPSAPAPVTA